MAFRKPEVSAPAVKQIKTGGVVTVACKMPNGLILQLQRKETYSEQTMTGPRDQVRYVFHGARHVVAGPAYPIMPPQGYPERVPAQSGYALTRNIPADFWEEWLEQNKDNPVVLGCAIYAFSSRDDVKAWADDHKSVRTGFEPLDVSADKITDPRLPKPSMPDIFYDQKSASARASA